LDFEQEGGKAGSWIWIVPFLSLPVFASSCNSRLPDRVVARPGEASVAADASAPAPAATITCPDGMALIPAAAQVDAFCIDRWEASLVEITDGGQRSFPYYALPKGKRVRAVSRRDVVPQGYISFLDAGVACAEAGKRLCKEVEWVRACKGPAATTFPYGAERRAGACNDAGTNAMLRMPAGQRDMNMTNMNPPMLLQLPNTVAHTGAFADCTNAYGVFDMVGNLHEWIADGAPPKSEWNPNTPAAFCGGFFLDTAINGDGCNYKTDAHADWYHDYSTGFRCCRGARD
jgi:hypothetical protein